jgi:uncharacterized beta-barrel protein YwiB (DUF1934 family)
VQKTINGSWIQRKGNKKLTKNVIVSIKGLQFESEMDGELIETINFGEYYKKNDGHYILYDEITEGSEQTTKNIIKFRGDELNMTKKGLVNTHMIFQENRKNISSYYTPYGELVFGIDARKVVLEENEEQILIQVDYALEVNYEFLADCKILVEIRPRNETS